MLYNHLNATGNPVTAVHVQAQQDLPIGWFTLYAPH